jgi:hypothetical protein
VGRRRRRWRGEKRRGKKKIKIKIRIKTKKKIERVPGRLGAWDDRETAGGRKPAN